MKKVYEDDFMSRTGIYEFFRCFQYGRENIESDDIQNIDRCENIQNIRFSVHENHRIAIRELSEECSNSYSSVQSILTEDLGIRHGFAKFVSKLLSADQKEYRLQLR
ncbi:hypothetical protein AVEN_227168-1 [Araneus ventricosus]|uniref:Uncharacterized protein n=1 Tax=Araneus ventricosus TaxID=182803 RepID=A0A4Y2BWI6_ARAVE|nr:hypothetical protein AVEN_227168-1 [Araneus ventricosus]